MTARQHVDLPTIIGIGLLLMPLLTMWHEIGGHAAACAWQGGHVATIGAFYVDCKGLDHGADILVALAGVAANTLLAIIAYALWRRAQGDLARLLLWLVWVGQGFVAAGYFCFSGVTGFGDLGVGDGGALQGLAGPLAWQAAELAFGITAYVLLVRAGIRSLAVMIGTAPASRPARRRIAHGYYATVGAAALFVGLLNPLGIVITIMSAAASTFGGLAGFISIGYAAPKGDALPAFHIVRNWPLIAAGLAAIIGFALVLGPSLHF